MRDCATSVSDVPFIPMTSSSGAAVVARWAIQLHKGVFEFMVLLLLRERPSYGYELMTQLRDALATDTAEGTIYPLLRRLRDDGLVTSKWTEQSSGMPRKYYEITPLGRVVVQQMGDMWLETSNRISRLATRIRAKVNP